MTDLNRLLDKIKQATSPSRGLDHLLCRVIWGYNIADRNYPRYTESLDDAFILMKVMLPEHNFSMQINKNATIIFAYKDKALDFVIERKDTCLALALCELVVTAQIDKSNYDV